VICRASAQVKQVFGTHNSLTVPAATFPGSYILELGVECNGQLQRAEAQLTVTNQAPVAADDVARTPRDRAKEIRVTANDHDPDDPDGYRTLVLVTAPPDHGTAEAQPDLTVVYTPQPGFLGTDRFTYSLCDDVLNPAAHADCGTATVTVTVTKTKTKTPVISLVAPGSTSPGKPVEVVGNTGSCGRAGTLTLSGVAGLRRNVTGDQDGRFAVTITVPEGIFPRAYTLELGVDCQGQLQRAEAQLTVANQAPVAADDEATTTPGTATTIDVTGNDHDPDTYRTIVLVTRPPDHGTAEAQPDQSIVYTPDPGFVGADTSSTASATTSSTQPGRPTAASPRSRSESTRSPASPQSMTTRACAWNPNRARTGRGCGSPRRSTPGWRPASSD
jgi:hypothetical protein